MKIINQLFLIQMAQFGMVHFISGNAVTWLRSAVLVQDLGGKQKQIKAAKMCK